MAALLITDIIVLLLSAGLLYYVLRTRARRASWGPAQGAAVKLAEMARRG